MNRLTKILLLAGTVVLGTAGTASATQNHVDPCPGLHVQVYNAESFVLLPHFVCGPIKGDTGPAGPKGDKGDTGATGETGSQGPQGSPGENGSAGQDGKDGIDGANGSDGLNGTDGKDGSNGQNGASGNDGAAGAAGSNGAVGGTGAAGTPADQSQIDNLRAVVTELNNRLFLLEHAVPAPDVDVTLPPTTTTTGSSPATGGTLPHTGSTGTLYLLLAGGAFLGLGVCLRRALR